MKDLPNGNYIGYKQSNLLTITEWMDAITESCFFGEGGHYDPAEKAVAFGKANNLPVEIRIYLSDFHHNMTDEGAYATDYWIYFPNGGAEGYKQWLDKESDSGKYHVVNVELTLHSNNWLKMEMS
jgi:hypothetical protein